MKLAIIGIKILVVGVFISLLPKNDFKTITVGTKAPLVNYPMQTTNSKTVTLDQLKRENGLLVIFTCNTCPFVTGTPERDGWEPVYNDLYTLCSSNRIGAVLVNSNAAKRPNDVDSMEEMIKRAKKASYQMPYALDKNSELADAFGARTTPDAFLFDKDLNLVYCGLIDNLLDKQKHNKIEKLDYLKNAIISQLNGSKIVPNTTPAMGCSIKRK